MDTISLLLIAVGLSMDAFAVSVAKCITIKHVRLTEALKFGLLFGGFQMLMPIFGWLLGRSFAEYIQAFDHFIAFGLLAFIGGKMIYESLKQDKSDKDAHALTWKDMIVLAVATSIDAMAVGVSFALMPDVDIMLSASFIGIVTFTVSIAGAYLGNKVGSKLKSGAEIFGGIILIAIGTKILIEHLLLSA